MPVVDDDLATLQDLKDAIASGQLSETMQKRAQGIVDGIEKPVRLGLLGLPKAGKSTLLNLLVGDIVIPEGEQVPTVSLVYSETPQAICTFPDGTTETVLPESIRAVLSRNPVFIEIQKPLPALKKLSLLEVVAGPDLVAQKRSLLWASKRIDIALWCSDGDFGEAEQDIWDHAPDAMQDRAYMMLTKSMGPNNAQSLQQRMANAKLSGEDFFKTILSIDAETAIAARKPDGSVDKETLRQSGGIALITAILRDVEAGRQGAVDQAHVFARQIDLASIKAAMPDGPAAAAVEQPQPVVSEAAPAKAEPVAENPAPAPVAPVVEDPVAEVATQVEAEVLPLSDHARGTIEKAVEQLTSEGEAMVKELSAGTLDDDAVMRTCVDTVTWLADYMTESDTDSEPALAPTRDAALDAADLIQLIRLETGDNIIPDALTLMVQLKQDMQIALAA